MTRTEIIGKILATIGILFCLACLVWFGLSWAEVITNNLAPNPEYSGWNLINIIFG